MCTSARRCGPFHCSTHGPPRPPRTMRPAAPAGSPPAAHTASPTTSTEYKSRPVVTYSALQCAPASAVYHSVADGPRWSFATSQPCCASTKSSAWRSPDGAEATCFHVLPPSTLRSSVPAAPHTQPCVASGKSTPKRYCLVPDGRWAHVRPPSLLTAIRLVW